MDDALGVRCLHRVRDLNSVAAHFYQVEIELQSNLEKERRWTLEIVDERGKKRKDVQVSFPQELPLRRSCLHAQSISTEWLLRISSPASFSFHKALSPLRDSPAVCQLCRINQFDGSRQGIIAF
jgi:hypothetical protein